MTPDPMHRESSHDMCDLLVPPSDRFVAGLVAIRDLHQLMSNGQNSSEDVETVFVQKAASLFPSVPMEQHEAAAPIVHTAIHALMDVHSGATRSDGVMVGVDVAQSAILDKLREDLDAATGDAASFDRYGIVWARTSRRPSNVSILNSSLLVSMVSEFEILVSRLIGALLTSKPEALRATERSYTIKDLEPFTSIEEFRDHCKARLAEDVIRGSFEDWIDWFSKKHKIDIAGVSDKPSELVEIFQRRNLLVHNGGIVNDIYLSRIKGQSDIPEKGKRLYVGNKYVHRSIQLLVAAGIKLTYSIGLKLAADSAERNHIRVHINQAVYEIVQAGMWHAVEDVAKWEIDVVEEQADRLIPLVNQWLARKNLYGLDDISQEVESWNTQVLSGTFRLAKLALLDSNVEAFELVTKLIDDGELSADDWLGWPLFEGVRDYAASTSQAVPGSSAALYEIPHEH